MMISDNPEATASSTTYWIVGLSTSGSISLGWALVAGRNRVPSPAAGNTALRTFMVIGKVVGAWSLVVGYSTPVAGQLYLLGFVAGDTWCRVGSRLREGATCFHLQSDHKSLSFLPS